MDTLKDLRDIYESANGRFRQYEGNDFVLPEAFKSKVSDINSYHISYNQYSAVVNSNDGLSIYLPNQWFYVASYFTEFYNELLRYKSFAIQAISRERLKDLNGSTLTDAELNSINKLDLDDNSKERLKKFITNYSWWHGGKTVDRGDFFVSPILNGARLVNQSQSYVADLCAFLADKPELVKIIIDGEENTEEIKVSEKIVSEKALNTFILSVISYLEKNESLDPIATYAQNVGRGTPIKVSNPGLFHLVGMFIETSLEDIKNRNTPQVRWFEQEFKLGARNVYLSTQWVTTENYQLTLSDFIKLINHCYGGKYTYKLNNGVHELSIIKKNRQADGPLQQIFYGAPGTGKSHKVKELTGKDNVVRTTFHPDSDYSSFVGCYKPTSIEVPMRDVTGKVIVENGQKVTENRIVYEFVEQAFLKAYIKAWKMYAEDENNPKKQYLVIEEINRGNCAQIFGDLFQLLDRGDNGFSEYPIDADKDMQKHLAKAFKDMAYLEAPAIGEMSAEETARAIRSGEKLILPSNLYIWATMNTSDQSLFPIDSAFKRRWDWQYVPIHDCGKGWQIEADGKRYDWWQFVDAMNDKIGAATYSEDKKLGYFFCKAKDGVIDAETFVGKVVFYIWNDVFKDFAEEAGNLFKDVDGSMLSFNKFYTIGTDGKRMVVEPKITILMQNLGVEPITTSNSTNDDEPEEDEDNNDDSGSKVRLTITFPDGDVIAGNTKFESYRGALEKIGIQQTLPIAEEKVYQRHNCSLIDTTQRDGILNDPVYSYVKVGDYYIVKGINGKTMRNMLSLISNRLNLDLIINYQ